MRLHWRQPLIQELDSTTVDAVALASTINTVELATTAIDASELASTVNTVELDSTTVDAVALASTKQAGATACANADA